MKVTIFSFTENATLLARTLQSFFMQSSTFCQCFAPERLALAQPGIIPLTVPLTRQVKEVFQRGDALIFISACGIAVRSIAPFVRDKMTDPCVLVIDEKAQYVISLLSGHLGGGNAVTRQVASFLNATPVISTATDLHHKFAVDIFAKNNHLFLTDRILAKEISASLLEDRPVGLYAPGSSDPAIDGLVFLSDTPPATPAHFSHLICICPFLYETPSFLPPGITSDHILHLIPRQIVAGMGCKKGTPLSKLDAFLTDTLNALSISPHALSAIASIDLKKEEPGLVALAQKRHCLFFTYSAAQLSTIPDACVTPSAFVQRTTGTDNVCERSALLCSGAGQLLQKKISRDGMTIALTQYPKPYHYDYQF